MSSAQQPIKTKDVAIVTPPLKAKRGKKNLKKIPAIAAETRTEVIYEDIPCGGGCGIMVDPHDFGYGFCSRACAYGDQRDY